VNKLIHLPEPTLLFGHGQSVEDPRDGLSLFGQFDPAQTFGVPLRSHWNEDWYSTLRGMGGQNPTTGC